MSTDNHHNADNDQNFDDLASHFCQKIYGTLKGDIRLAVLQRDLKQILPDLSGAKVLDIGAGMGQISLSLAAQGLDCTLSDSSQTMLSLARQYARDWRNGNSSSNNKQLADFLLPKQSADFGKITFLHAPYQKLPTILTSPFDLILCHALLEWIECPDQLFAVIDGLLRPGGILSLCFYNPAASVYRNLLLGNFHQVQRPKPTQGQSLTPKFAQSYETVQGFLQNYGHRIRLQSGIRVFYDYAQKKQGGLLSAQEVIAMELAFSQQMPYWRMGRYLHMVTQKP